MRRALHLARDGAIWSVTAPLIVGACAAFGCVIVGVGTYATFRHRLT